MKYPEALQLLIDQFRRYPGIGKKTAERYALFTLDRFQATDYDVFRDTLKRVQDEIKPCLQCGNLTDEERCYVCSDPNRDHSQLLVVEEAKDVLVIENAKTYKGLYHVLGGVIKPSAGIGPEEIRIKELLSRLKDPRHKEVILATNLSDEGETTALYIDYLLSKTDINVTRIAHGLPAGSDIAYADEITLLKALEGRKKINR